MSIFKRLAITSLTTLALLYGLKPPSSEGSLAQTRNSPDRGDLMVRYEPLKHNRYRRVYRILQHTAFYDELVADLNASFSFPRNIRIVFDQCDEPNAFYDPETVEIIMCYELIKYYADITHREFQEDYALEVIYAGFFTFYHELGHAMIDQYQLPITGQEEDAVDEFAAILLIDAQEYDAVIAGMDQFDIDAIEEAELGEELVYWDEHSFSDQRFYNTACLIYGSAPDEFSDWVYDEDNSWDGDAFLPVERAEICEADYQRALTSWERLLAPYLK